MFHCSVFILIVIYHQRSIWLGQFIFHISKKNFNSIISPKICCITKDACSQKLRQFQAKKGISYFLCVLYYIHFRILCWWRPASNDINFYRNWPKSSYVILEMIIFFYWNYFFRLSHLLIIFQQQSDIEWKYGFAKLIRNYHTTNASPPPINLVTTWTEYIRQALGSKFIYITKNTVC